MKKILLILFLIQLGSNGYSQDVSPTKPENLLKKKEKGFVDVSTIGVMFPSGKNQYYSLALSLQTCNGYRFNNYFALLGGTGIDLYGDNIIIPVFIDPELSLLKGSVIPILDPEFGYGLSFQPKFSGDNGFYLNVSPGVKIRLSDDNSFVFCIGYKRQYFSPSYQTSVLSSNQTYVNRTFNQLNFVDTRVGIEF